ncbi:uncharacterized protein BO97DRAFT_426820 [Aspergillus homomorphus CBS 101889]|uniref:Uncharacterized protein n=1 Tax=Aspergillus homomorphus (strain CBS 101889) TaxID=1450537 RepID=A0A395HQL6_ASPHC|nr:hypothetical protein BO97DRAFT_426820 [Aspergillus homomorphus CBS 101889]RAL10040.1 hypothetical protein BO97DRAFT_426820 [Aspergillus homomorphus CBS 101889]
MPDRQRIYYTFDSAESYMHLQDQVVKIIQEDTGKEFWICNRALPPSCYPPPLTTDTIDKLKELDGVKVGNLDED